MAVLAVSVIIFSILYAIPQKDVKTYRRSIERAELYYTIGNYEQAVIEYRNAVNSDRDSADAYEGLSNAYAAIGDFGSARSALEEGFARTKSMRLNDLLQKYLNGYETGKWSDGGDNGNKDPVINMDLIKRISSASYGDYSAASPSGSQQVQADGSITVRFSEIPGLMIFRNTAWQPYAVRNRHISEEAYPAEILLDAISSLTGKIPVTKEELEKTVSSNVLLLADSVHGHVLRFSVESCEVTIECSGDGTVSEGAWNQIVLSGIPGMGRREDNRPGETVQKRTMVIDAQTGDPVDQVTLYFRQKGDRTGEILAESEQDDDGYLVQLPPGEYTVEVSGDGYITDYYDITIDDDGNQEDHTDTIVVSRDLENGEIRIVLEWGERPSDLDSHLTGETDNGTSCHVSFRNLSCSDGEGTVAELDLDDTSSYGPETITLYRISGSYKYSVNNFSPSTGSLEESGATVTVYMSGSSPETFSIGSDGNIEGDWWHVFTIDHGRLKR